MFNVMGRSRLVPGFDGRPFWLPLSVGNESSICDVCLVLPAIALLALSESIDAFVVLSSAVEPLSTSAFSMSLDTWAFMFAPSLAPATAGTTGTAGLIDDADGAVVLR